MCWRIRSAPVWAQLPNWGAELLSFPAHPQSPLRLSLSFSNQYVYKCAPPLKALNQSLHCRLVFVFRWTDPWAQSLLWSWGRSINKTGRGSRRLSPSIAGLAFSTACVCFCVCVTKADLSLRKDHNGLVGIIRLQQRPPRPLLIPPCCPCVVL